MPALMDINEIEENLNNFPADPEKVLTAVLNCVIKIQANTEFMLTLQAMLVAKIDGSDERKLLDEINENLNKRVAEIQAIVSSSF